MHEFDKCVVISVSGSKLAEGFVHEFDADRMKVCANDEFSTFPTQAVTLFVYNRVKGECAYTAKVERIDGKNIIFTDVVFLRAQQKRDNTRVDKTIRARITHRFEEENTVKLEQPIDFTILNISAQGMYISCDELFAVGFRFPYLFREAGKPINLTVEVMRCDENRRGNNYGCQFVGISEKDMDNIFRFVLHEQIEQRRRNVLF